MTGRRPTLADLAEAHRLLDEALAARTGIEPAAAALADVAGRYVQARRDVARRAAAAATAENGRRHAAALDRDRQAATILIGTWQLTDTERAVIQARTAGASWQEVAAELHITRGAAYGIWRRLLPAARATEPADPEGGTQP